MRRYLPEQWIELAAMTASCFLSSRQGSKESRRCVLERVTSDGAGARTHHVRVTSEAIPQWCIEYCNLMEKKLVACIQPRRISAVNLADRVSKEMDVRLGKTVGYSIRFENVTSSDTKLNSNIYELMAECVCDLEYQDCMIGTCKECPGVEKLKNFLCSCDELLDVKECKYQQWISVDRTQLITIIDSKEEFIDRLLRKICDLTRHSHIAKAQTAYMNSLKSCIEPEKEIILQGDFAENFHWENAQTTLDPFCALANSASSMQSLMAKDLDLMLIIVNNLYVDNNSAEYYSPLFVTDGVLLREIIGNSEFHKYGVICLDEAHERSITMDVLMALLKEKVSKDSELRIVIMSATLEAEKFINYFKNAPVLTIPGFTHPVELIYTRTLKRTYAEAVVSKAVEIHRSEITKGDILIFLTGKDEINKACADIEKELEKYGAQLGKVDCIPLYSTLSKEAQNRINDQPPKGDGAIGRKIIISTNIAETSLTIDGVTFVIDSGFTKQKSYDPRTRIESLQVTNISKASANQRKGRAGRTAPGKCFRLYTEDNYNKMKKNTIPEILRSNLATMVLGLKKLGIHDVVNFDYIDPPDYISIAKAIEILKKLDALDQHGELTNLGALMADFPLEPQLSRMLIHSKEFDCTEQILTIVAMLSDKQSAEWCKEYCIKYNIMIQAEKARGQLSKIMTNLGLNKSDVKIVYDEDDEETDIDTRIGKTLASGFFLQVAKFKRSEKGRNYYTCNGDLEAQLLECTSCTNTEYVIYNDLIKLNTNFISKVSKIEVCWLPLEWRSFWREKPAEKIIRPYKICDNYDISEKKYETNPDEDYGSGATSSSDQLFPE
ncbi:Pre-mRNA-splicing factor ATP-dependent RNA helicase DHX15 [Nymphon striatum]|nr:Pre-mRNA-splicing factor ATP-dependent RNA helicase DHX15 [Nymphon striatum]